MQCNNLFFFLLFLYQEPANYTLRFKCTVCQVLELALTFRFWKSEVWIPKFYVLLTLRLDTSV